MADGSAADGTAENKRLSHAAAGMRGRQSARTGLLAKMRIYTYRRTDRSGGLHRRAAGKTTVKKALHPMGGALFFVWGLKVLLAIRG